MQEKLAADIKQAMLGGNKFRAETLKLLKSALMYAKIDAGAELDEQQFISVVRKELKKRQEAIMLYEQAGRTESAQKERDEAAILQEYAPESLSGDALKSAFDTFKGSNAELFDGKNFGMIMKTASEALGDVDKQQLAGLIKEALA